jgi:hypothetical protein
MWFETTTPFYTHNAERGKTLPRLGPTAPWTPAATHPVDEAGRRSWRLYVGHLDHLEQLDQGRGCEKGVSNVIHEGAGRVKSDVTGLRS